MKIQRQERWKFKKRKKKVSFFAKEGDIKRAMIAKQHMIVLLYKEVFVLTNDLNVFLPSVVVSLLQDYDDVLPKEIPQWITTNKGNRKSNSFYTQIGQPIRAIMRKQKRFIGKLVRSWRRGMCVRA